MTKQATKYSNTGDGEEFDALNAFSLGTSLDLNLKTGSNISKDIVESFVPGVKRDPVRKYGESSLKQLLETEDLTDYLLSKHTFIYGKIGFYKTVLDTIHLAADVETDTVVYLGRASELKGKGMGGKRVILLPTVGTTSALNSLISQSLNRKCVVWLISYPSATAKHVMLNFHNFFIASSSETEIKPLRDIVKISDDDYQYLTNNSQGGALFVTDFRIQGESTYVRRIRIA